MRKIALLGMALCLVSLLLSARAADSSVTHLINKGVDFISGSSSEEKSGSGKDRVYDGLPVQPASSQISE